MILRPFLLLLSGLNVFSLTIRLRVLKGTGSAPGSLLSALYNVLLYIYSYDIDI